MELYHVTLQMKEKMIKENGVDPKFAHGKMTVTWWVDRERLFWALAHVSAKYGIPVDGLVIFSVESSDWQMVGWARKGIYYCYELIHADMIHTWRDIVKPEL